MNDLTQGLGPLFAFLLMAGGLIIAVIWFIFPFVVNSALNRIQRLLQKQNQLLESLADKERKE